MGSRSPEETDSTWTGPRRLAGPALILGSAAFMFWWTFGAWADPIIDFGRELYVPWQMMEGKRLYGDLTYYYGPFSPYLNLLWFRLLGVSYLSLVSGNALLFLALLGLFYIQLKEISSAFAATIAGLVAVFVFGFSQYVDIGNYNFMSPYSHEVTHGLLIAIAAITALWRFFLTRRRPWLLACGILAGLTFLTKHEVFVALSGAMTVAFVFLVRASPFPKKAMAALAVFLGATVSVPILSFGLLCLELPPTIAMRGILGPYPFLLNSELWANPFFAAASGVSEPVQQLGTILRWSLALFALLLAPEVLRRAATGQDRWRPFLMAMAFLLPFAANGYFGNWIDWSGVLTPLPLFLLVGAVELFRRAWRISREGHLPGPLFLGLTLTVFSLLLLLKMPLNARVHHYGFAMALPGALLAVVAWLEVIPRHLKIDQPGRGLIRAGGLGAVSLFVLVHLVAAFVLKSARLHPLGEGADLMWVDRRGPVIDSAVRAVRSATRVDQTLVVFPEGAMINFLARRASSIPHITFLPTDFSQFGEPAILRRLEERPPDFVLMLARPMRDLREYGCMNFGEDCGRELGAWVRGNYRQVFAAELQGVPLYSLMMRNDIVFEGVRPQ